MVRRQLVPRGIRDERILRIMERLDRREFVGHEWEGHAFHDGPLPLTHGQTISQPYIVAFMTESLELGASHRVLEIGTGSGYQTAVLAELCREVITVERFRELSETARARLGRMGYTTVTFVTGDGSFGWPERAPYDRIVVTAAGRIHKRLVEQLAPGGLLVAPEVALPRGILEGETQILRRWRKRGERGEVEDFFEVRFVPLVEGPGP
ncbi:protein-L-isoaspartate(D-aspartate) O-methyltransferase [Candidatus Poribacteria bacterium]|nr:protein-L-isoaspartate(D-aspartate) O-methyltransferase [Candidatus Poribacteria bacterium]